MMSAWIDYWPNEEKLRVVQVRSADDLRSTEEALERRETEPKSGIQYPYGNLILTNISPVPEMGSFSKKNIPIVTNRSDNSGKVVISNAIPVKLGIGLSVRSDNLSHIIKLAMILMFSAPKITLMLQAEDSGFTYNVMLDIDPEMAIPQADMGHPGKEFRFDSTIILTTYMVRSRTQGVIREIRFGIADATGQNISEVIHKFESLDVLLNTRLKYTDIVIATPRIIARHRW